MKIVGWVCLLWLSAISSVTAVPIQQGEIPPVLQDWVPWVLHDEQEQLCEVCGDAEVRQQHIGCHVAGVAARPVQNG